ncbi:uncharacterized protein K489DRAFT_189328 [Dissoconium aciculare CBS 342.82]|uniref:Uncharacterized protein n=1 Tax=Dissoconium aciculare CBS 342.82 TaxID=1314786 RepID=A0A6J3MAU2_9PEZI|nr:uncharacterized protein K489DRAFT_189328 [Dissoconium aciculare CBS 342.82]KAF1824749.1 hypothetical protein K489DRAFT_189328 [Dissoconium aciculare CBS 342.82]
MTAITQIMSKVLRNFFESHGSPQVLLAKLLGKSPQARSHLTPSLRAKIDAIAQLRIDCGEKIGDMLYLHLQINREAKSPPLRKYMKKSGRGSHATLATAAWDTRAKDQTAISVQVSAELHRKAREALGYQDTKHHALIHT